MREANQKLQKLQTFITDAEIWTIENLKNEVEPKKVDEIIRVFADVKLVLCSPQPLGKPKNLDSIFAEMEKHSCFKGDEK